MTGEHEIREQLRSDLKIATEPGQFCELAEAALRHLGDEDWAREIYFEATKHIDGRSNSPDKFSLDDYLSLAEHLADPNYLGDREWAKAIYYLALKKAKELSLEVEVSGSVLDSLKNESWAETIYKDLMDHDTCLQNAEG